MSFSTKAPILSRKLLRRLDWLLISLDFSLGFIGAFFTLPREAFLQELPRYLACYSLFVLMSLITPVGRSVGERRAYAGLTVLIFTVARAINLGFGVVMYWAIAKLCFLLSRREAILATVLMGISYLLSLRWSLPIALAIAAEQPRETQLDPRSIFLDHFTFYVGASSFTILIVLLVIAEQRSRRKAEALAQQVETLAATVERTRIAREIHDSLGHHLTTLDVQLELAQRLHERDPEQTSQSLATIKQLTHQCLVEVRRSVQTMREKTFDLEDAIATLAESFNQNLNQNLNQKQAFSIQTELHLPPLPPQMGHQLYCIVQEGLTNIRKHAQATRVTLMGKQTPEGIVLVLNDNGQGFNPQAEVAGFGLRGMRERSQILGGTLEIQSATGQGTSLQVVIPYAAASSPSELSPSTEFADDSTALS